MHKIYKLFRGNLTTLETRMTTLWKKNISYLKTFQGFHLLFNAGWQLKCKKTASVTSKAFSSDGNRWKIVISSSQVKIMSNIVRGASCSKRINVCCRCCFTSCPPSDWLQNPLLNCFVPVLVDTFHDNTLNNSHFVVKLLDVRVTLM